MPVPSNAPVEGGSSSAGDRHVLVLDNGNCFLYELYNASVNSNGSWNADSTAVWDLLSDEQRPYTWTSADAAGLPIFPGLVRYDEVAAGADSARIPLYAAAHAGGLHSSGVALGGKYKRSDGPADGHASAPEIQL